MKKKTKNFKKATKYCWRTFKKIWKLEKIPKYMWKSANLLKRFKRLLKIMRQENHQKLFQNFLNHDSDVYCIHCDDFEDGKLTEEESKLRMVHEILDMIEMYEDMLGFTDETRSIPLEE